MSTAPPFSVKKPLSPPSPHSSTMPLLRRCYTILAGISFRTHLFISILLRLLLIMYGQLHDSSSEVPYTDIDYKVVTDGARQVLAGRSPFERHTYRYSPLLAYLQLPNVLLHPAAGKLFYSSFDLFVALLIYVLVRAELRSQCRKAVLALLTKFGKARVGTASTRDVKEAAGDERGQPERVALVSACFWLYNPLTAVISTRGNGDSFSSFFVILTIYLLARADDAAVAPLNQSDTNRRRRSNWFVFAAGLSHGFAIHLRLYPLLFSLAYYLSLSERLTHNTRDFMRQLFRPSAHQLLLVAGTVFALLTTTGIFYHLYGWQYIYEAYLYHFVRKDVRHNFSLYFLMQYLSGADTQSNAIEKLVIVAPQLLLLLYLSFGFGQYRQTLPFCVFALAFVAVTYNSVVTSQYFVWYLALLPLCLNNLQSLALPSAFGYFALWLAGQALWLLPAYLLEFRAWNTFYWLGAQGALFFLVNNFVLARLIEHYSFTSFKVNFKKLL